jgi:hypothetical protein
VVAAAAPGGAHHPVPVRFGDELLLPAHGQGQDGFGWEEHLCLLGSTDAFIVVPARPANIGSDCVSCRAGLT